MEPTNFAKAIEQSSHGYSIIPLRRNKLPLLFSWKQYQTVPATDEEIEKWWVKYPQANIGIVTGKVSGITVIDIDMTGGSVLADKHLELFPKTFTVKTPTGGYHLYYEYNKSIQQTANTFPQFPHVDIRNDGGYVVAPPSFCDYVKGGRRTAGSYKVLYNYAIAPFPIELFREAHTANRTSIQTLVRGINAMQEGDGRNNALTKITGKILALTDKKDWDTIGLSLLHSVNRHFKNPLPESEVKTIFNSISKKEANKPLHNLELIKNEKGAPVLNEKNVHTVIVSDEKVRSCMRFNIFTGCIETNFGRENSAFESYQRDDILQIRMYLMEKYSFLNKVPHQTVEDVLVRLGYEHQVSPPVEWLKSLTWDKNPRLDTWLASTYGVPQDEYHKKVGANWMKGLVKRIIEPGCKFDFVLVIEGEQGIKKSTSLKVLGGDWHVETTLTPDNKDFFMLFAGKAIVEFSEGETLSRTEAKRLKAVITIQVDKYRVPYDKSPHEFPRQCVFAMTTNQEEYLKDETGNRRWLPISCQKVIDIEWLQANREQLYAEAYHRAISLNETVYEFPEEETKVQQAKRQISDPRTEPIYVWYFTVLTEGQRSEGITTQQAFSDGIHRNTAFAPQMTKSDSMIIGSILVSTLKLKKRHVMKNGLQQWRYMPTSESTILTPVELTEEMKTNLHYNDF